MAKETQIGNLVIDLQIKTAALEKGLNAAKTKLKELEQENEQIKNSNKGVDASFVAMSAGIVASIVKIKSAVDDGIQKYNQYTNQMKALQKTAKATDNSFTEVKKAIEDVNKLKLMDDSDVTTSMKNLMTYGFTVKQAADTLKVLQDAAVGNRQASYSLSEAVRVTTEGIRMENSVLSDAAGVQKNIAKMYEEHAKSIGKKTDALTQAEKVQAVYNGIMAEAAMFEGTAQEMAEGYQGTQAQLNATNLELSRNMGQAMLPAMEQFNSLLLNIQKGLTQFIGNNKSATAGIITFTTTLLGTVAALTAVKKAIVAYKAAAVAADMTTKAFTVSLMTNPVTLIAVGIAATIAGLTAFNTKMQESIDKMNEATEAHKNMTDALANYMENGMTYTKSEKSMVEDEVKKTEQIVKIYEDRNKKIAELNSKINKMEEKSRRVIDKWKRSCYFKCI